MRLTARDPRVAFFGLVSLTLFADLASKAWAVRALANGPTTVIPGRLNLVLAHNPHGAMGFLHQAPGDVRRIVLVSFTVLASIAIVALARRAKSLGPRLGLALILGGALGNVIDRVASGAVVDFIDVIYAPGRHWFTFNVADVAVVVGAVLLSLTRKTG